MTRLSATAGLPFSAFTIAIGWLPIRMRLHPFSDLLPFLFPFRAPVAHAPSLLAAEVALRLLLAAEATPFPAMVAVWAQRRHLPWAPTLGRDTAPRLAPVAEPFRRQPTNDAWVDELLCLDLRWHRARAAALDTVRTLRARIRGLRVWLDLTAFFVFATAHQGWHLVGGGHRARGRVVSRVVVRARPK